MSRRSALSSFVALTFLFTVIGEAPAVEAAVAAQSGDASIARDATAGTYTLYAGGAALTLVVDAGRDFALVSLTGASGRAWATSGGADSFVRVGGRTLPFGHRGSGFELQSGTVEPRGQPLQLHGASALPAANLVVTRHYAIVSGSPSFEAWTTFAPNGPGASLSDLNALSLTVPAGTVRWLTGLLGDAPDVPTD